VETVGDCYVAACGISEVSTQPTHIHLKLTSPFSLRKHLIKLASSCALMLVSSRRRNQNFQPRKDHAVIMARFASETLAKVNELTEQLACSLGPGTDEVSWCRKNRSFEIQNNISHWPHSFLLCVCFSKLALRIGLHSGPVTAGVLRSHNARFQLFGDTVRLKRLKLLHRLNDSLFGDDCFTNVFRMLLTPHTHMDIALRCLPYCLNAGEHHRSGRVERHAKPPSHKVS
jgi:class 3 adenylate cyclase